MGIRIRKKLMNTCGDPQGVPGLLRSRFLNCWFFQHWRISVSEAHVNLFSYAVTGMFSSEEAAECLIFAILLFSEAMLNEAIFLLSQCMLHKLTKCFKDESFCCWRWNRGPCLKTSCLHYKFRSFCKKNIPSSNINMTCNFYLICSNANVICLLKQISKGFIEVTMCMSGSQE